MKIFLIFILIHFTGTYLFAQNNSSTFLANTSSIDSLLSSYYKDSLPGISLGIFKNNQAVYQKSTGVANLVTKEPIQNTSAFNIASLTKQFTAAAILQLEEKKKLSLGDKISRFFPDMNKKAADIITVKQLLTHTSGLIDHYNLANTKDLKHAHNIDVYNAVKNVDSTYFLPGSQFRYSNTGYCLLALIIEKVSGMSYNDYMTKHIFNPAGMAHTQVWKEMQPIEKEVMGYEWDSTQAKFNISGPDQHIFFSTEGDGGIYTTVQDYAQWFQAFQTGKVVSNKWIDKARSLQFNINKATHSGYGFGWFIDENEPAPKVYHSGSNSGFRSFSFSIPSQSYLVIIFSNRDDVDLEIIVQKIVHLQWPDLKPFIKIEALTS